MLTTNFKNKVALVAGGTGALGREISLAFLRAGARVIATYRRPGGIRRSSRPMRANAMARTSPAKSSMRRTPARWQRWSENSLPRQGGLDILVNAVGGYAGGKKVWEEDPATYERMMALNLRIGICAGARRVPDDDSPESRLRS